MFFMHVLPHLFVSLLVTMSFLSKLGNGMCLPVNGLMNVRNEQALDEIRSVGVLVVCWSMSQHKTLKLLNVA